jgi:antitoxin VapB
MKTAKLFKNGQSQAVRLPKEFRMTGSEVYIKKQGEAIVLLPKEKSALTLAHFRLLTIHWFCIAII